MEVNPSKKTAEYRLTSTIIMQLVNPETPKSAKIDLGGSLTRQVGVSDVGGSNPSH
jgi:hypothetical protein